MNIYSLNLNLSQFMPAEIQYVDLDSIQSISPISVCNYTGFNIGRSHADYTIYVQLGHPILISYISGTCLEFPENLLKQVEVEQNKLVDAWKNIIKPSFPTFECVSSGCQAQAILTDYQRGRIDGIKTCYDYILQSIGKKP
jgi:hypothetical protein